MHNETWVKLVEISDVISYLDIQAEVTTDMHHLQIQTLFAENATCTMCYHLSEAPRAYMTKDPNCTLHNGITFQYRFQYISPSALYYLGDIQYNVRKSSMNSCDNMPLKHTPIVTYFRENVTHTVSEYEYLHGPLSEFEHGYRFYGLEDLIDVETHWRSVVAAQKRNNITRNKCFKLGKFSPRLNPEILVPCSNHTNDFNDCMEEDVGHTSSMPTGNSSAILYSFTYHYYMLCHFIHLLFV